MSSVNPSDLIKQLEKEIQVDSNFVITFEKLINYYQNFEKQAKNIEGNYYKIKAFLLMINGQYKDTLNLKGRLLVIL